MSTGLPKNPHENPASHGIAEKVPNYLVQSILVTLCCCPPLGIVAIVYAIQVNSMLAANDVAGARVRSRRAKIVLDRLGHFKKLSLATFLLVGSSLNMFTSTLRKQFFIRELEAPAEPMRHQLVRSLALLRIKRLHC